MFDVLAFIENTLNKLKKIGGENHVIIEPTRSTTSVPSDSTRTCYLDQSENRVYFRGIIAPRSNFEFPENTSTVVWTVPEEYAPERSHALSIFSTSTTPAAAIVTSSGQVLVRPKGNIIGKTHYIYITGWWDIKAGGGYLTRIFSRLRRWRYV